MSLLIIAAMTLIALQFTSAIGQFISEDQQATATVAWLQWLVAKIGLAPTIITTRVIVIGFFVILYLLQLHFLVWLIFAAAAWYLYKTGSYLVLWRDIANAAGKVVNGAETDVVAAVTQDITKVAMVDQPLKSVDEMSQAVNGLAASTQALAYRTNAATSSAVNGVDTSKFK